MSNRWVCRQCSKTNREDAYTCRKCGTVRGIDALATGNQALSTASRVPLDDDDLAASPSTPSTPRRRGTRWLRFWWIPAAVIGFIVVSMDQAQRDNDGRIASAGSMAAMDLQVGDCFDHEFDETGEEAIDTVRGVPCGQPHVYEVFAIYDLGPGPYPTDDEMDAVFFDECLYAFDTFVGVVYEESELWVDMFVPSRTGWDEGDRSFTCFLYEPDAILTGSMRDANR